MCYYVFGGDIVVYKNERNLKIYNEITDFDTFMSIFNPLIAEAKAAQDAEGVYILKMVTGTLENQATKTVELKGIGLIDYSIAPLIQVLNANSLETYASCSGLEEEHNEDKSYGYISFADTAKTRAFVEDLCSSDEMVEVFSPSLSKTYFKDSVSIHFDKKHLKVLKSFVENRFK